MRAIRPASALDIIVEAYPGDCDDDDDDVDDDDDDDEDDDITF